MGRRAHLPRGFQVGMRSRWRVTFQVLESALSRPSTLHRLPLLALRLVSALCTADSEPRRERESACETARATLDPPYLASLSRPSPLPPRPRSTMVSTRPPLRLSTLGRISVPSLPSRSSFCSLSQARLGPSRAPLLALSTLSRDRDSAHSLDPRPFLASLISQCTSPPSLDRRPSAPLGKYLPSLSRHLTLPPSLSPP